MYSESELLTAMDSGIQTVVPQAAIASPQTIYLDFDGANASYYNRALGIYIDNVAVEDSGFDSATISVIVSTLNDQFGDDVVFTSEIPSEGEFSTIYIGVTSAFDEYGSFYGLAETIDSGNQIRDDNAFVLLDSSASAELVVSVIAHETEHVVHGMDHGDEGIERFALITVGAGSQSTNVVVINDTMLVDKNGLAINTAVGSDGVMHVWGMAVGTTIIGAGIICVYNGGTANATTVASGGVMSVYDGGTASVTIVASGGDMSVCSGGKANSAIVSRGGSMEVSSGGTADVVENGGYLWVLNGGTANSTTVFFNGSMFVSKGGTASVVENGGYVKVGDNAAVTFTANVIQSATLSNASMTVHSGTTANAMTVDSAGTIDVFSGGTADETIVNSSGRIFVQPGGTVGSTTVNANGKMYMFGTANQTTVNKDGLVRLYSNGMATSTTVSSGGSMEVLDECVATSTTVCGGGIADDNGGIMSVCSGGSAHITTVSGGQMLVYSQGQTNITTVSGGYLFVFSQGQATSATVNNGEMWVQYGGTADSTTVNGGVMEVYRGGTATGTTVNGDGKMRVFLGGEAAKTTINANGAMLVWSDGIANSTTVNIGGAMFVSSGGTANSVIVGSIGITNVYNSGTVTSTTVNVGSMIVSNGGTVNSATVHANGVMIVSSGGTVKGTMQFENGAVVSACTGAVIDFTVATQTDATTPLINRYDLIGGAADIAFTLTVKASQLAGRYALAAHAQNFDSTISVKTIDGDALGDVSLATPLANGGMEYKLALDGAGTLTLNVKVEASFVVSMPEAGGENSFDEASVTNDADTVGFDSSYAIYNYSEVLLATHGMVVIGNGTDATTLSGGALYLAGNETSFSNITLDGQVFGGFHLADGSNECGDIALSFSDVAFTDGARLFGGADVSGTATATVGDISLGMEDVDGGSAKLFGAGRVAGEANLIVGDIDATISCVEGGSFSNYFAGTEARSGFTGSIIVGEVSTVIDGGEFTYCGNGSQLRGGTSVQDDSTLTINGGEFNYFVYAGAFSAGGNATVDGGTTLIINGGTFNSHVFSGCGANNSTNGANTFIDGDVSVTVDATNNSVSFAGNLYAGSIGEGTISGSTTMTFTGDGSNLSFAANSYVTGGSQMSKNVPQYIGGTATLAFDGFSGDFSANVNNGFTNIAVIGSNVSFTGQRVILSAVTDWAIEVADDDAALTLAKGKNNFADDSLALTLAEGAAPTTGGLDVIVGTNDTLAGWDAFSSVTLIGEAAEFSDGAWTSDSYRLYRDGNAIRLASIG